MALDIKVTKKKNYVYLMELAGSLDTEAHKKLEDEVKEIIDDKTKALILDMAGVTHISSAGISVVLWAQKTLKQKQAAFAITSLKPQIEKVFEAMKILPMIDVFNDMPEADKYIDRIRKEEIEKQKIEEELEKPSV